MTWLKTRLSDLLETCDSGLWGDADLDRGISVLRSTNIMNDGSLSFDNLAFRDVPAKKREEKRLRVGDIVLENSGGGPKQPVGRVSYFGGDEREHVVGNFCRRLRPIGNIVSPKFLFWLLFYGHLIGDTLRYQTQTIGLRNLQFKRYADQPVWLPPLSEQRRIVDLLDQADALRRLRRDADAKAARILPALFLKMFGNPATNPMGWPVEPFDGTFRDTTAGNGKLQSKLFHESGALAVIDQGKSKIAGYTDDASLAYKGELPVIVFGDHTRSFKFVDHPFVIGADGVRVLTSKDKFSPLFAYWHCQLLDIPSAGYSRHFKYLKEKMFIRPDKALQIHFADMAGELMVQLETLDKANGDVEHLFSALLQKAFAGDLTAQWRQGHMEELLTEMKQQAKALNLLVPKEVSA